MSVVRYTEHLKLRLKIRKIPEAYPRTIYQDPEEAYYDTAEGRWIAVRRLHYSRKTRPMMIAYDKKNDIVEIVTIHPISEEKILNRLISGRWTRK